MMEETQMIIGGTVLSMISWKCPRIALEAQVRRVRVQIETIVRVQIESTARAQFESGVGVQIETTARVQSERGVRAEAAIWRTEIEA